MVMRSPVVSHFHVDQGEGPDRTWQAAQNWDRSGFEMERERGKPINRLADLGTRMRFRTCPLRLNWSPSPMTIPGCKTRLCCSSPSESALLHLGKTWYHCPSRSRHRCPHRRLRHLNPHRYRRKGTHGHCRDPYRPPTAVPCRHCAGSEGSGGCQPTDWGQP